MKKFIIFFSLILLVSNSAQAYDDWYYSPVNPSSPTNLMTNPANAWFSGNIFHDTDLNIYKNSNKKTYKHEYNICIMYKGGSACKKLLKN